MTEERRLVTVLFADVTGSTAMGAELDPEDMRALLARYLAIARDVVSAYGGTLEKFIGDAVIAVFGLPTAHDDAARAAAAALALRDQVRDDPGLGDRLPIRLGLNTGEAVASRDGSAGDFLVTGDAVNVAARLQQAAGSWEITRLHYVERAVALCADLRHPIPIDGLDNLLSEARTRDQRLLTAQTLRARGIQEQAPDNLREALEMFRGFGARPLVARVEVELGQLTDDAALVASGTAGLEALGDVTQLGREASVVAERRP